MRYTKEEVENMVDSSIFVSDKYPPEENSMEYWFPRLENLKVNTPETRFFEISWDGPSVTADAEKILNYIENKNWDKAFVRSANKHAELNRLEGSVISVPSIEEIKTTIKNLAAQHVRMQIPTGGLIAVREWIDLDYCSKAKVRGHNHQTEVRFFIKDGEILYWFPEKSEFLENIQSCGSLFDETQEVMNSFSLPLEQARTVAREFNEKSWSVDFVMDRNGTWYCIDMGPNGLYWNEKRGKWNQISEHREDSEHHVERYIE